MFLEFCNKYKKCRVAVFDKDGNIIQISQKIPLVSLGNFYLQDISYDVKNNRIKPSYIISVELLAFINMMCLFSLIGTIGCIITLIVDKINQNKSILSYKGYIIASSLFNIPDAILIIFILYCGQANVFMNITGIFTDSFYIFLDLNIISVISPIINICVLVHFIRLEKKLRMKKYLEEKHRAESLDKSENM